MTAPLLCVLLSTLYAPDPAGLCAGYPEPGAGSVHAPSAFDVAARTQPLLPAAKPEKGRFLVAARHLNDPNFAETVILLLSYSNQGAMGVIVNRPTEVRLASALPNIKELHGRPDRVFLGGPVSVNAMLLLIRSAARPEVGQVIFEDVYVTGSLKALQRALDPKGKAAKLRAYAGYAGWGPRQLDHEIERGDWLIGSADAASIFDTAPSEVWRKLIDRLSVQWARSEWATHS